MLAIPRRVDVRLASAVIEATEEAIVNALMKTETMTESTTTWCTRCRTIGSREVMAKYGRR